MVSNKHALVVSMNNLALDYCRDYGIPFTHAVHNVVKEFGANERWSDSTRREMRKAVMAL